MTAAIPKRRALARRQVIQLMLDQSGICGCGCGEKLQPMTEGVQDEHVRARALLGEDAIENRSLWRRPCSKAKDKLDVRSIAKAKRQAGETGQTARRAAGKTKQIRSPGFDKSRSRKFNGQVVPRTTPTRRET